MRSNRWHVHFSITKIFTKCKIRLKNTNVLQGILDATAGRQNSDMLVDYACWKWRYSMRESLRARNMWGGMRGVEECEGSQVSSGKSVKLFWRGKKTKGNSFRVVVNPRRWHPSTRTAVRFPSCVFVTSNVLLRRTNIQTLKKIHCIRQYMSVLKMFTFGRLRKTEYSYWEP